MTKIYEYEIYMLENCPEYMLDETDQVCHNESSELKHESKSTDQS